MHQGLILPNYSLGQHNRNLMEDILLKVREVGGVSVLMKPFNVFGKRLGDVILGHDSPVDAPRPEIAALNL
jgi:hypothetical protein